MISAELNLSARTSKIGEPHFIMSIFPPLNGGVFKLLHGYK